MLVYTANKAVFIQHVIRNEIESRIEQAFTAQHGHTVSNSELVSWRNSMQYMMNVLNDPAIPDDAGVAIEYTIPQTSKRVDFILTGRSGERRETAVIIELKQWTEAQGELGKDAVVETFLGGQLREVPHPSYQAWTYAVLLEDFNETVRTENIQLRPCAYLHNCTLDSEINADFYKRAHDPRLPPS